MQSLRQRQKPKNQNPGCGIMIELTPIFSNQKKFHKKAMLSNNGKKLFSYDILVAEIIEKNAIVYDIKTESTTRHVIEFLKQNGKKAESKKQIIEDYFIR